MLAFFKSRTMLFALSLAIFGVLEASMGVLNSLLTPIMGPAAFGVFTVAVSVIVAVLRVITTQPLSEK
jgi:uncharacterized membrane protein (DUF106 family)